MMRCRRSRYEPGGAAGLRLTERDIAILKAVARYRLLSTNMIGRVLALDGVDAGGTDPRTGEFDAARKIRDRLTELFHGGLLNRPRASFSFALPGSEPMTYALAAEGIRVLRRVEEDVADDFDRASRTRHASRGFIEHQLLLNDTAIRLRESVAGRQDLALTNGDELACAGNPHAMRFSADVRIGSESRRVGIVPDLAVTIRHGQRTHAFFIEIDRSTEPAVRLRQARGARTPTLAGTSILRKMLGYAALKSSGEIREHLGWRNFKVLFLCQCRPGGGDRVGRLLEVGRRHAGRHTGLFLFASQDDISKATDILQADWRDAHGNVTHLDPAIVTSAQGTC